MTRTATVAARGQGGAHLPPQLAGLRPNERIIYDALAQEAQPIKAYALLDHLHERGVRSPMTVYRALGALVEKGLARKVHSQNAFVATGEEDGPLAYVTCRRCGETRAMPVDLPALRQACPAITGEAPEVAIEVSADCGAWCGRTVKGA